MRMGLPKQLLTIHGTPLLKLAIGHALKTTCDPIVVVLGAYAKTVQDACDVSDVSFVVNQSWNAGIHTTIQCGVQHALERKPELNAVIISVCDQPFLSEQVFNGLVQRYRSDSKRIVASEYSDTFGVPALFDRIYFRELRALPQGGAKKLMEHHVDDLALVSFSGGEIDLDTKAEYQEYIRSIDTQSTKENCHAKR